MRRKSNAAPKNAKNVLAAKRKESVASPKQNVLEQKLRRKMKAAPRSV